MKVLVGPVRYLGLRHGSDANEIEMLLKNISMLGRSLDITVLVGHSGTVSLPRNITVQQPRFTGFSNILSDVYFQIWYHRKLVRLLQTGRFEILHHMWPSGNKSFRLEDVSRMLSSIRLITGPLLLSAPCPKEIAIDAFVRFGNMKKMSVWTFLLDRYKSFGLRFVEPLSTRIFEIGLDRSESIIAINSFTRSILSRFTTPRKIRIIPWGIDTSVFSYTGPRNNHRIICLGALFIRKGQHILLKSLVRVAKEVRDVEVYFVGWGPQKMYLERLAHRMQLTERVKFLGFKPTRDVVNALQNAQVFCLPTLHEAFGLALVEAMSCGLPCVSTSTTGPSEIIKNGESGYLVRPGDPEELADKLIELLTDYERCVKMGILGRYLVDTRYDIRRIARQYVNLYGRLDLADNNL